MIPFALPTIGEAEVEAVSRALRSKWVTQGPEVEAFEREFAEFVGARHACAVSSCTAALHLALLAVDVQPGDEVITASHSFIATANAIRYCGAIPVFVDINPHTLNIEPDLIEEAISERTRAILAVHQVGMPCDLDTILSIGRRHNIPVVEDAACAIGSEIRMGETWQRIGQPHGEIACFSFHPRKVLTTGDGGMLTTNDSEVDRVFRMLRHHAMDATDLERHRAKDVVFESYPMLGFNYRMTDLQGAMGRAQLSRLPEVIARRRELGARYGDRLSEIPGVAVTREPDWARTNWQSYCLRLPENTDQKTIMRRLTELEVSSRRGVMCAHREGAYPRGTWTCKSESCDCEENSCDRLSQSEQAQDQVIMLPLFPEMTFADQDKVVTALRKALES